MSFATPAKNKRWELLHSLWIGWTLTLGFFSWVAFVYIALRTRHTRWLLWALFYATPIILFIVPAQSSSASWDNLTLSTTMVFGVVSIIHAFLVRKEYLLRLELLQRATSNVSVTSRGRRWELLHSLWIGWTLTWGLFSWVALLYIGLRARYTRWILWSILYFTIFVVYVIVWTVTGAQSTPTQTMTGPLLVVGIVSIVHAFLVRNDYLVRLENRIPEAAADDMSTRRRLEEEYGLPTGGSPSNGSSEHLDPTGSSGTDTPKEEQSTAEGTTLAPPATTPPPLAPVETNAGSDSKTGCSPERISISDSYPLPIAHSWSLLAGLWDPRDRYREQLRHAENMLAFLGSVSIALLEKQDLKVKELQRLWSGGITLGGWKWIIQRNSRALQEYKDNPLARAIYELHIDSPEESSFGADVSALLSARNDHHHGRGPTIEEDIVSASNGVQERLQRCMEALAFLARYPIRLIQDFDIDRHSGDFIMKCVRLTGDGPGFPQEKVSSPEALPRGDLFIDLGHQTWVPLYPFVIASNCPYCRYRETYFIDRWDNKRVDREKGIALMKSFERGHTEERRDISDTLATVAADKQESHG